MVKLEDKILEQLEKEAKAWMDKEYRKRQEIYREEVEKQVSWAQEHGSAHDASAVRAYHEQVMARAMSELRMEIQFEADQWIIAEMAKKTVKGAGRGAQGAEKGKSKTQSPKTKEKPDAGARGRGDAAKKATAKIPGTKSKAKTSSTKKS